MMFEGFGSEIGVMNTALIGLIGSFFAFLIKHLGPPWKWGKLIREIQEFRKTLAEVKDNPGHGKSNSGTVTLKPEQMPGVAPLCRQNRDKLIEVCGGLKDMKGDVEKLERKIDKKTDQIHTRINEIRELIR